MDSENKGKKEMKKREERENKIYNKPLLTKYRRLTLAKAVSTPCGV